VKRLFLSLRLKKRRFTLKTPPFSPRSGENNKIILVGGRVKINLPTKKELQLLGACNSQLE